MTHDDLLSVDEAAQLLQINAETIRSWIDRGLKTLPGSPPDDVRIRRADLDEFLQRENQGHPADPSDPSHSP